MLKIILKYLPYLLFIVICTLYWFSCSEVRYLKKTKIEINNTLNPNIKDTGVSWKDKQNNSHKDNEQIILNKEASDILFKKYKDSIAHVLNLNKNQITGLLSLIENLNGNFSSDVDTVQIHDTVTKKIEIAQRFSHSDSVLTLSGFIYKGKANVNYNVRINLQVTEYWRWKHKFPILRVLWCKKIKRTDATCNNPNIFIENLTDIKIIKE